MSMRKLKHAYAGTRGNALLIVLAAIGLFAALSLVVSQSAQDGGNETETAGIAGTEIIQYMSALTMAIDNLKQYNGCTNGEISFQRDWDNSGGVTDIVADGYKPSSPTSPRRCHVFDREGAGFEYRSFGAGDVVLSVDYHFAGFGTGSTDIVLAINRGVTRDICQEVNRSLDLDGMHSDSDGESGYDIYPGMGGLPSTVGDGSGATISGVRTACYQSGAEYIIYSVLYPL